MKKLGIIAGNNSLPLQIAKYCKENNIIPYIILIKGFAKKENYLNYNNIELKITSVGKAIKYFKNNDVKDIVFAGGVKKPSFNIFTFDLQGIILIKQILKNKFLGDNSVLNTVINFFNNKSLNVLEIDKILPTVHLDKGFNSNVDFGNKDYLDDIELGKQTIKTLSFLDIGQSVVAQNKNIIGIECFEGTEKLINRCAELKYNDCRKPILIKIKKENQTRKADLPTIGKDTIIQLHNAGFGGIAIDAENCLVVSINEVIELSNKYKIFIYGI